METRNTTMTVSDYCNALDRGEITVNRDYQRSDKVWPDEARSFLIETIVLSYPIPKISLYSKTNLQTRQAYKEIVDGQQRTVAISDFFHGRLTLSADLETEDLADRTYEQLDPELQQKFVDYPLSIDLFVGATEEDVRETFRRMNSYTIPLNPEEQRHAVYQGKFKWSTYGIARKYDEVFSRSRTFSDKGFIRMADLKLLTEIIHAYFNGVTTTNKRALDKIYRDNEKRYAGRSTIETELGHSIEIFSQLEAIHRGPLARPYMAYSLLLAIWHKSFGIPSFAGAIQRPRNHRIDLRAAQQRLSELAAAVLEEQPREEYLEFVEASIAKTNVRAQRETRIRWMLEAL